MYYIPIFVRIMFFLNLKFCSDLLHYVDKLNYKMNLVHYNTVMIFTVTLVILTRKLKNLKDKELL